MRSLLCALLLCWLLGTAPAQAQVTVTATLLGADGKPMKRAHIVVKAGPVDTTIVAGADERGALSFQLPEPGGYGMYLMGVHHETLEVPLVATEAHPVELEVRLATARYREAPDSVRVVTSSTGEDGVLMRQQADGTFTARVETTSDTLAYQIHGVKTTPWGRDYLLAGTQADRFVFNSEGRFWGYDSDYISVFEAAGTPVEVTFDPRALPRSPAEPVIRSSPSAIADIASIYLDVEARERRIGLKLREMEAAYEAAAEAEQQAIRDSLDAFTSRVREPVRQRIETEPDPLLRQWLMLRYFDELHPPPADSLLARRVLVEVPPTSPFWSYEAWSNVGASNLIFQIARVANDDALADAYIDHVIEENTDPDVRAHFLYRAIERAAHAGDEERRVRYYSQLQAEHGDTWHAEQTRRQYAKERAIQAGRPVPNFSFTALDDTSETYTDNMLRGTTYLIDFWGTWCGPCIEEMPYLHEAYEQHHDRGFEILSVAVMDDRASIQAFREERWPMPWMHTLVASEDEEAVRTAFEITGFPRPILVDTSGRILAVDGEIRGEKLKAALARVLGGAGTEDE